MAWMPYERRHRRSPARPTSPRPAPLRRAACEAGSVGVRDRPRSRRCGQRCGPPASRHRARMTERDRGRRRPWGARRTRAPGESQLRHPAPRAGAPGARSARSRSARRSRWTRDHMFRGPRDKPLVSELRFARSRSASAASISLPSRVPLRRPDRPVPASGRHGHDVAGDRRECA